VAAAAEKAAVQPPMLSSARKGTAERTCPAWPDKAVSWVIKGTRAAGNHRGTSASVATSTKESATPIRTRPATSTARSRVRATQSCPIATSRAPRTRQARLPHRSTSIPEGICSARKTTVWASITADSTAGLISSRSVASIPATPRVVRCITVRVNAVTPTAHTA
jgi:hypothetical protein